MEDYARSALDAFHRAADEFFAGLTENLNRDIAWDAVFVDEAADEVIFGVACRRKTN